MTREEIFEGLKEVLATVKPKMDLSQITPDSNLVNDLQIDSLSMLLMSLAIETKFGFQFNPKEMFKTVGQVIDYIFEEKNEKKFAD